MKKKLLAIIVAIFTMSILSGCCFSHDWQEATCEAPMTCAKCNKTKGVALGHSWKAATCTVAKKCTVCLKKEGEPLGHTWVDATCTEDQYCSVCNEVGEPAFGHDMSEVSCEAPATCKTCGATEGKALLHTWLDTDPMQCEVCKYTLPENTFSNHKVNWVGVSIRIPDQFEKSENCTGTKFVANSDAGAFTMAVDRTKDVSLDTWAEAYRASIKESYRVYDEEKIEVNGKEFYTFTISYKNTYSGKCVIYVGDRVKVYMEMIFLKDTENIEDMITQTLGTLDEA